MPRLKSSKEIIKTLENHGFIFVSQKGSHGKFCNVSLSYVVIVPMNKREIPVGTFLSIVRQSRLDKDIF
ncbi:MAG: type II toxin-antitoxin system HicA family toxin [Candidatus Paceibacterota bacterium]